MYWGFFQPDSHLNKAISLKHKYEYPNNILKTISFKNSNSTDGEYSAWRVLLLGISSC